MKIEQLQMFSRKGRFISDEFESEENTRVLEKIEIAIYNAFSKFVSNDLSDYDSTTRANMLNNHVSKEIKRSCESPIFAFYDSLTFTRRSFGILDDNYVLLFKKSPIANLKTNQDDILKFQELDRHVLFVTYSVDDFWSEIQSIEVKYLIGSNVIYSRRLTEFADKEQISISNDTIHSDVQARVVLKANYLKKKTAE